jgi:hypothetical protein
MKKFTIAKEVLHSVWYRYYYEVEAETKEEAIKKFTEDEDIEDSFMEAELLYETLQELGRQDTPPYHEIDGEYFTI